MRIDKNMSKNFNIYFQILENNKIERKVKKLLELVDEFDEKNCLICCKHKNINTIKETFKKRNIATIVINSGIILFMLYFFK